MFSAAGARRLDDMTVSAAEVRADEPLLHGQAPTGQEFLRLTFSATNDTAAGFAWVFDRDLHLRLPDGTVVATADNCGRAQIYPRRTPPPSVGSPASSCPPR